MKLCTCMLASFVHASVMVAMVRCDLPRVIVGHITKLGRKYNGSGFIESNVKSTGLDHRFNGDHKQRNLIRNQYLSESEYRKTSSRRRHHGLQMKRMKKSEINDLVKGLGLEPVISASSTKKRRKQNEAKTGGREETFEQSKSGVLEQSVPDISLQIQLDYARKGHSVLRSFLPTHIIQSLRSELVPYATSHALDAWKQKVEVQLTDSSDSHYRQNARSIANSMKTVEECQDMIESLGLESTDLPFLQHFNTWRAENDNAPTVKKLCLSAYLAQSASILLDSPTVRLYQDSLFHKRPGDGWTPYHSDARMAPFDTSKMITFWIPLQKVPLPESGGTGLLFVDGSHNDFALPYWNGIEGAEYDRLDMRYFRDDSHDGVSHHMPLEIGDVTVHNGWTLHCADAADTLEEDRYAFAVSFVCGRAEVREDVLVADKTNGDKEDAWSYPWVADKTVKPRSQFRHPHVPIVWPPEKRDSLPL